MLFALLDKASYLGIVLVLLITGFGLPLPEELVVILSGILSRHGEMNPYLAYVACLVGAIGADCILYGIGYRFGHNVVRDHRWFVRFVKPEREERLEQTLERYGLKVLCAARFLVGVRSAVFLAAGVLRIPFYRFLVVDLICASTVIGFFFALSYRFATQITDWFRWIRGFELTLTAAVIAGVAFLAVRFWRQRRARWHRVLTRRGERRAAREALARNQGTLESTASELPGCSPELVPPGHASKNGTP